jgi:hypothetical protein
LVLFRRIERGDGEGGRGVRERGNGIGIISKLSKEAAGKL